MSGFLVSALLLTLFAIALLVWPLLRQHNSARAHVSRQQLNTTIYRDQLDELERDLAIGTLSQTDYEQAKAELQRRMIEDVSDSEAPAHPVGATAASTPSRASSIAMGAFILIAGAIGYMALGNPLAINPPVQQGGQAGHGGDEMARMVADLAAKLEREPENYRGWAMLARSYKVLGRYHEAARAYARTGTMLDTSAELLIDYADTLAAVEQGFTKEVMALIDKALKLEPHNTHGLWLRGTAFYQEGRYDKAIVDWELLLKGLPPGSEEARVVTANIAEARQLKAADAGKPR